MKKVMKWKENVDLKSYLLMKEKESLFQNVRQKHSAGYDFEAAEDIVLPSIWKMIFKLQPLN